MNSAKKNNQSARSVPGKSLGCVGIRHVWTDCFSCALPNDLNYGACGTDFLPDSGSNLVLAANPRCIPTC